MAVERSIAGVASQGSGIDALSRHAARVARSRDALAGRDSPLDSIPAKRARV